jgi:CubicO group peptidase (beta-lactamase class C family)
MFCGNYCVSYVPCLRHLLTHTSGISHDLFSPLLRKWLISESRPPTSPTGKLIDPYGYPLVFEPGTGWSYGAGIDWAGKMVERASKMSLQHYMEQNIWEKLEMDSATIHINQRPDLEETLANFSRRLGLIHPLYSTSMSPSGRLVSASGMVEDDDDEVMTERGSSAGSADDSDDDRGVNGLYCSAPDFAKLLHSICCPSTSPQILQPGSISEMFTPQLSSGPLAQLQSIMAIPEMCRVFGGLSQDPPIPVNWGLGGMLAMKDVTSEMGDQRRGKGSMFWSGLPNIYWWMDRIAGVSGVYASQLLPQGDPASIAMLGRFEETVYERVEDERTRCQRTDGRKI